MDPELLLRRLCRRKGVPHARGARLLPLVARAAAARPAVRRSLIAIVERELDREALQARRPGPAACDDERCLAALARALHGWSVEA
jgi:hypothetical protein